MKPLLVRALLGVTATLSAGSVFPASAQSPETPRAVFVTPSTPAEREIQDVGENAIDRLAVAMVNEVRGALASGSAEDAVDMCHLKGLSTEGGSLPGMPRISAVKLTSLKVRSPDNTPDDADKLALASIDRTMAAGDAPPKILLQRVTLPDSAPEWRVYKPLGLTTNCLVCHGNPADQSAALRAKLHALYPDDQATGYKAHEWRGLIRVTVSEAPTP